MTDLNAQHDPAADLPEHPTGSETPVSDVPARGPHKRIGILLLKLWGGIYATVAILYVIHLLTGFTAIPVDELDGGRRLGEGLDFKTEEGLHIEIASGDIVPPATAQVIREYYAGPDAPTLGTADGTRRIAVYKESAFHKSVPWVGFLAIWNFLGLVLLLYTLVGDLLPKMLANHAERVEAELATARAAREEAEALRERREAMQQELDTERQRLQAKAGEEAKAEHERLVEEARDDIRRMREALERHIETEIQTAADRLRAEFGAEAVGEVRSMLAEGVDDKTQDRLVSEFIIRLKGEQIA
jgi:F-type H+-transporting ATPase subunit b